MVFGSPVNFQEINEEALVTGGIVMVFALIFGTIAILQTYCEHHHISVMREASVPILFGLFFGLITILGYFSQGIYFDSRIFSFALLPIIVFKEGYCLNKQHFMKNYFYVLIYGIFGTIVQFLISFGLTQSLVSSSIFWSPPEDQKQDDYSFFATMFFSACITSKDSAVSLSVLEFEHAPKLHSIIFGEQIINDVIVFALSSTTQRYNNENVRFERDNWYNFLIFIALTLAQLLVGLIVGLLTGNSTILIFRCISEHSSVLTIFTIYCAYFAFSFCEAFDFCGVMAVLICGIMMSHYQTYNLPKLSANSSKYKINRLFRITVKALAYASETFIYFYIGFAVTATEINNQDYLKGFTVYPFVLLQFFVIQPMARFLSMLLSQMLAILIQKDQKHALKINLYEFLILCYSGLIKGVIAYALICEVDSEFVKSTHYYPYINFATLYLIFGTTLFIGGSLKYVTEWAYSRMDQQHLTESSDNSGIKSNLKQTFIREDIKAYESATQNKQKWFKNIDENYIKPFLIYNYLERKQDILTAKKLKKNKHAMEKQLEEEMQMYEESVRERREKQEMKKMAKKSKLTNLELDSGAEEEEEEESPKNNHPHENQNNHH
ncbi:unnamed protein product (macronuclear) [Paramecium tetraurelia]|uniref:Cation/H+ exchanger transmembrane domain-containing protein n=1 Tax=Paramecium tetraurelia TaxID=5888 RepID=A0DXV7_PARTE|nr:uncharacterized protein GSPATT00021498001 [Paramecium tetraurelia]CAK87874.1 unnamed protein product [Paramecium tetraurelia]|eukprot:XP_001455271.1 hypothetical protein (macronuclear) [Paramecium tetraurelia strain d4-2]